MASRNFNRLQLTRTGLDSLPRDTGCGKITMRCQERHVVGGLRKPTILLTSAGRDGTAARSLAFRSVDFQPQRYSEYAGLLFDYFSAALSILALGWQKSCWPAFVQLSLKGKALYRTGSRDAGNQVRIPLIPRKSSEKKRFTLCLRRERPINAAWSRNRCANFNLWSYCSSVSLRRVAVYWDRRACNTAG